MHAVNRLLLACALPLAASCGSGAPAASRGNGAVRIAAHATALSSGKDVAPVCANFTLVPLAPGAGGAPVPAGEPLHLIAGGAAAGTDQIAGCIDGPNDAAGYNWGYLVTVDTVSACGATPGTLGAPLANAYPVSQTLLVPVHCVAGQDSAATIAVQVSVATPNAGGYVDISVGVDATTVQTGCKQADLGADHLLHFGESHLSIDGTIADGLVALDTGAPTQFGGVVTANGNTDTYYSGVVAPSSVHAIYQTFLTPCAAGEEFAEPRHAQCLSDNSGKPDGTIASLADAFVSKAGQGFAAVSVVNGGLQLYSSLGSGGPATMTAGSGFAPAYNPLEVLSVPSTDGALSAGTVTGVYVDQDAPMQFLVAASGIGGAGLYSTLSHTASGWAMTPFSEVTGDVIACNGLYAAPRSCFVPKGTCSALANGRVGAGTGAVSLPPLPIDGGGGTSLLSGPFGAPCLGLVGFSQSWSCAVPCTGVNGGGYWTCSCSRCTKNRPPE